MILYKYHNTLVLIYKFFEFSNSIYLEFAFILTKYSIEKPQLLTTIYYTGHWPKVLLKGGVLSMCI